MQPEPLKAHAFRLRPGQDLKMEIQAFADREQIEAGWVITCVGSLTHTHLRLANQSIGSRAEGPFEIVSLVGTVSRNGCHLHLCVCDGQGLATGGHLLGENIIYTTAEVVIGESPNLVFTREKDGTTEWAELQVRKKQA